MQHQATGGSCRWRVFAAELIGTFVFTYLGQCANTSFELTGTQNDSLARHLCVTISYGIAYLFGFLLTASLAPPPATLNPALAFSYAVFKIVRWSSLPAFFAGQYAGALLAAPCLHVTFSDKISHRHDDGLLNGANFTHRAHGYVLSTGKFFTSFPPTEVTIMQLFISYMFATCLFTLLTAATSVALPPTYDRPTRSATGLIRISQSQVPVYVALALVAVLAAFGANGGPVINPAQDIAPRIYLGMSGWGASAFDLYHYYYFWFCGLVAPHVGACIGISLYQIMLAIGLRENANRRNKIQPIQLH